MKKLLNTLYITSPDRYLSVEGENVVVLKGNYEIGRVPLHNLEAIITYGYTGASPALMGACAKRNVSLSFMNQHGGFVSRVTGKINGNVILRKQQYFSSEDKNITLRIAKRFILAKIFNSRWVLERITRDNSLRIDVEKFKNVSGMLKNSLKNIEKSESLDNLRGIEGEAASLYFSLLNDMILQQKDDFIFESRNRRPPMDNVNTLLSYVYSLLCGMYVSACESVGLDPCVGFMHKDRPGRASLALDLMEEARSVLADRFVLTVINKKIVTSKDFSKKENGSVIMNENGRKQILTAWQNRKTEILEHPFLSEKIEWGMVPYVQALLLARFLRGDLDDYPPFMWK